jgi:hypothetical protein
MYTSRVISSDTLSNNYTYNAYAEYTVYSTEHTEYKYL